MDSATPPPRWDAPAGKVIGWHSDSVVRATGIRYARARRYERPTPEPAAQQPIDATSWAPACPQNPDLPLCSVVANPLGDLPFDEDCLRLSLTLPGDARADETLPVLVWIHGGSYVSGAGDAPIYDPAALVREQRVIVVSVSYRLGLFGFLGRAEGNPANLGLFDLIEALRWVQRNVAAFRGDPTNVTLIGSSAGGDAIAHLLIAHGAEGLFRRAIIHSPPLGIARGRSEMSHAMADEAAMLPNDAPAQQLLAAQSRVERRAKRFGLKGGMPFGVQYGFDPLPDEADVDAAWRRVAPRVDVLIGSNTHEIALFALMNPFLAKALSTPGLRRVVDLAFVKQLSRLVYDSGIARFVKQHRRGRGRGYRYSLSWGAPANPYAGAHAAELPLLFPKPSAWEGSKLLAGVTCSEVGEQGRLLRGIWAEFARSGVAPTVNLRGLVSIRAI